MRIPISNLIKKITTELKKPHANKHYIKELRRELTLQYAETKGIHVNKAKKTKK
jgi:hypothetical protein